MEKIIAELKLEKEQWQQRCHELEKKVEDLEALVKYYEEEFRFLKHKHFGKSSEKT